MNDDDFQARIKELYQPPKNKFVLVDVPEVRYLAINGHGDPKTTGIDAAMRHLWAIVEHLVPAAKQHFGRSFKYPPLECQFWTDQRSLMDASKDNWHWRVMVVVGNWASGEVLDLAKSNASKQNPKSTPSVEIENLHEQQCVQIMHVGDYDAIGDICAKLYGEFLPKNNLQPHGYYHEIYLNDPNKTPTGKRKCLIRQPVRPV